MISESSAAVIDILDGLYVQDIDAEEESGSKDKDEFKQDCLALVLEQLFDEAGMAQRIPLELGEYTRVIRY
jgi:hypothetical protein